MISKTNNGEIEECHPGSSSIDEEAILKLQYGVYIIGSAWEGKFNGQIATVAFQVTCEPIQIVTCLSKNTLTHSYVKESNLFSVSVLEQETPMVFIGRFGFRSGRDIDKFSETHFKVGNLGCPLVEDYTVAVMEATVIQTMDVGTHTLFVGKVHRADILKEAIPMTYAYYHEIKKGKSPENAPTHIGQKKSCQILKGNGA